MVLGKLILYLQHFAARIIGLDIETAFDLSNVRMHSSNKYRLFKSDNINRKYLINY